MGEGSHDERNAALAGKLPAGQQWIFPGKVKAVDELDVVGQGGQGWLQLLRGRDEPGHFLQHGRLVAGQRRQDNH